MSKLSDWILKWWGSGNEDDQRNWGWRISEALRVQVLWALTILDIRLYPFQFRLPYKTEQNFWNGFFTVQIYLVRHSWGWLWSIGALVLGIIWSGIAWLAGASDLIPFALLFLIGFWIWPTLHVVFRPVKSHFLLIATPGILFDRGEYHCKVVIMKPEGSEPTDYSEGSL